MSTTFAEEKAESIQQLGQSSRLRELSRQWVEEVSRHKYCYNFSWLGRPIIQFPQDTLAIQEIICNARPDLIIETGIAHGGSIVLSASCLELLGGDGIVVGIDIDIRAHNRRALEEHPLFPRMRLIEGSSTDAAVAAQAARFARDRRRVMVILDSNHTHQHVAEELALYAPLVTKGSYLVVCDTIIEELPDDFFPDRPWGVGNNPSTALREFLAGNHRFEIDAELDAKLMITASPGGYLRCIQD